MAGTLAVAAVIGWTALFVLANLAAMQAGGSLAEWTAWIRDWSVPVLLVAVAWLIGMRNSRREALRFGETARLLGEESARLESRLTTVNRELSLAREFISAQARDIDTLGRVAGERLSQHADKLAGLIADNGTRLDSIQTVSAAALENMEALRGHLPVIASSAKDVTNNIGNAGRTAHAQVEELITGFNRLNQFGQASERQVMALRTTVDETLAEFTRQTEQLDVLATQRFAALAEKGAEFRTQLETQEVEALAAIRNRAAAMAAELEEARAALDAQEGESLTSLRARLTAVRDESAAIGRSLREGEDHALIAWKTAIGTLENDLTDAIARVGVIDEKAMASARNRLTELAKEAEEVDSRMADRDRLFVEEIERRRAEFEERQAAFITQLGEQMADLDARIAERRAAQEEHGRKLVVHSETMATQLDHFARKMEEIASLGGEAEGRVAASLAALGEKLAASREALSGTDTAIAGLTDGSVRLLELIQASVQHSTRDLPEAMGVSEARLSTVETRLSALKDSLADAEGKGQALSGHVSEAAGGLTQALTQVEALSTILTAEGTRQAEQVDAMRASLESVRSESLGLAEQAQAELRKAIDELNASAKAAVSGIAELSAGSISKLAASLGEESGAAIEKAMRSKAA
ncbi:MAG TPA: ATPase, partial [Novosphingobium sp.]|nr:ATPase [Novosphingobium sp.]